VEGIWGNDLKEMGRKDRKEGTKKRPKKIEGRGRNKKKSRRMKGEGEKEGTVLISFAPTSEPWRRH